MEQFVIFLLLLIVVISKGLTLIWLSQRKKQLWELESEGADVSKKLASVEATKLQLEREKKTLDREVNLLENDKNLLCLEIQKLGVQPVDESELDAIAASAVAVAASGAAAPSQDSGGREGDNDTNPSGQQPSEQAQGDRPENPRSRILVVDDNEDLREVLQQILTRNYEVFQAVDGFDALTKIVKEKQHYDLVVTDLQMPNINGVTLAENLPKGVPVIVISAYIQREEFREALRRINPVAILQKPFKLAAVRVAVETALGIPAPLEPTGAESDETVPQEEPEASAE